MAIGDLKERLRQKFHRRKSTTSSIESHGNEARAGSRSLKSRASQPASIRERESTTIEDEKRPHRVREATSLTPFDHEHDEDEFELSKLDTGNGEHLEQLKGRRELLTTHQDGSDRQAQQDQNQNLHQHQHQHPATPTKLLNASIADSEKHNSASTVDFPTPNTDTERPVLGEVYNTGDGVGKIEYQLSSFDSTPGLESSSISTPPKSQRPSELSRKQSLLPHQQTRLIKTLLETDLPTNSETTHIDYFTTNNGPSTISPNMVSRKIWVKRPGASATLVTIHEDDLVDDVRDMILKKYANSLGRSFDAPDVTLRIIPREQRQERTLSPDEPMGRTLDAYYPGGQGVDEALVIDVPVKRTPRASPQPNLRYYDEQRPAEAGSDYFPQMPAPVVPSPRLPNVLPIQNGQQHSNLSTHSMSVLTTGHVPPLPSPGSGTRRHHRERPRIARQHTASPTVLSAHSQGPVLNNGTQPFTRNTRSRTHSSASEQSAAPPVAPPLPTPPAQQNDLVPIPRTSTPPPKVTSPRPSGRSMRRSKKSADHPSLPSGMLNSAVPPINVLIVEDNIINLKLLEAFMKRLKVRWQTAMNGREAVTKWRAGGFHLVLMDIQLPIMSGLEATKEIRRLERLNSIGVFSSSASSSAPEQRKAEPEGEDKLSSTSLFKSPVIIVALTASSLQSDRHEALAAGCNDFLTKVCSCFL